MFLHRFAEFGDEPLRCLGEQLGQRKRSNALDDGGQQYNPDESLQASEVMLVDDIIDQKFGGGGKDKT